MPNSPFSLTKTSKKQTSFSGAYGMLAAVLPLAGCEGIQSTLAPRGPQARVIADISWIMFGGASAILLLVMCLALYAVYRSPGKRKMPSANTLILAGGVALPVVTLSALLIYTVLAMGGLRAQPADAAAHINVVGNRWWWDVHYLDKDGNILATTANEIRIPAGRPVAVSLNSDDVIHSFWVPNLAGKIDLIPGRTNELLLQADAPGTFRGQCAEFCGAQHARMAFYVIAEPQADFDAWMARLSGPAQASNNQLALRGRAAFIAQDCIACHTVRGIGQARERGPDLTHLASRQFIGAGTLENTRDNLQQFIAHSQLIKPGNGMPDHAHLDDTTLQALAAFLESLH